jgi:ubiquinone/menaquinone biosynthesis C-methylase UbiE
MYVEWFELESYHWWFVGRREIFMRMLDRCLNPVPGKANGSFRITDMGCGTGVNLDALSRFGSVFGVDVSETALSFCRERKDYRLCQAPMSQLPFRSASIHLLTAFDVLEHGEDDEAMLSEAFRVLAPGGRALFAVPAYRFMWGDHDVAAHHYRRYTANDIRTKVEACGFQLDRMTYINSFLFPISVVFRHAKNLGSVVLRALGKEVKAKSDFRSTAPPVINPLLRMVFTAEDHILKHADLPFGLSICCIVRKP